MTFAPLGKRRRKGWAAGLEVFEVRSDHEPASHRIRDPVCGIEMARPEFGVTLMVRGRELAFCCERCLRVFLERPEEHRGT